MIANPIGPGATLRRKWHTWRSLPHRVRLLLLPAWLMLGVARLLIRAVPFRHLARQLGQPDGTAPWVPLVTPPQAARASQIRRVVMLAARLSPWQANCLPQALCAHVLLRLHGVPHALYFGVQRRADDATLQAHAWTASGPVHVTGGASFGQFTVVSVFVWGPSAR